MGQGAAGVDHQQQYVDAFERSRDFAHHLAVKRRTGLVYSRRIHEYDLPFGKSDDALNAVTGGLRLGSDDGHLLANQAVQQCRFSSVGAADDGHKSRAGLRSCLFPCAHGHSPGHEDDRGAAADKRRARRRSTLRWFDSKTSKRYPARSILSFGAGTLPRAWLSRPAMVVTVPSV